MTAIKLYNELAQWWPIFSAKEDYADEAACFRELLLGAITPPLKTLVELGSGAGNNAFYLKRDFAMTLVDVSPGMVEVSRTINPECEHLVGDMRTVRLGRVFDAVFIHDAIMYITTEDDLRRTVETAYVHVKPGGVALLAPDFVRETFKTETDEGGHDGEGRSMRWLSWSFPPAPGYSTFDTHFVYMLKDGDHITVEHDLHTCGVFAREVWLRLLEQAGFHTRIVVDNYNRDLFVALKPDSF